MKHRAAVGRSPVIRHLVRAAALAVLSGAACGGGNDSSAGAGCPPGFASCDGACTAVRYDPSNCGTCGHACGDGQVCAGGECALQCGGGTTRCGDICANTASDTAHCGGCNQPCHAGELCVEGVCTAFCPAGFDVCSGACVRLSSDVDNCGACGKACKAGEVCSKGMCVLTCPAGMSACDGECVNPRADPRHCGGCDQPCITGQVCLGGACYASCPSGFEDCGGVCVDTKTSLENCGQCDHTCGAGQACVQGSCRDWCPSGQTACPDGCVDLDADNRNCGACGTVCDVGQKCLHGSCSGMPNGYPLVDAWGYMWDGIQRPARTWQDAVADCESVGARLPTATELYRNSATQTNVSPLGEPHQTSWLWTLIPTNHDDVRRALVRWSDGGTNSSPESTPHNYRCVWPDHTGDAFEGDFCNGTPGSECATVGLWWNVDTFDRPALDFAAAVNECAFYHASIPTMREAQELIQTGWSNPSSSWLWVADSATWYLDNFGMAMVRWTSSPQPQWGYDAGTDGSRSQSTALRAFRCIGKRSSATGVLPASPACSGGGCVTVSARRARLVADSVDRPPAAYAVALETCRAIGGSLPDVGEIAELIHAGWVGAATWLWSAEPQWWTEWSYDSNYGYAVFSWNGAGTPRWIPGSTTMSVAHADSAHPFRCVWRETFEDAQTSCSATQNQTWDGSKFVCKAAEDGTSSGQAIGSEFKDAWGNAWDGAERAASSFANASATCAALGGRLPSPTELYRVRASQTLVTAIGDASATSPLWTWAQPPAAGSRIVIRVSDGATGQRDELDGSVAFRCIWPGTRGAVLDARSCTGTGANACVQLGRIRVDPYDRPPLPLVAASSECAFFGGHLPDHDMMSLLVHEGAPNGSNGWLWLAEPVQWYPNLYGYALGRWSGVGTQDWAYDSPAHGALSDEADYRAFRCVYTDTLR